MGTNLSDYIYILLTFIIGVMNVLNVRHFAYCMLMQVNFMVFVGHSSLLFPVIFFPFPDLRVFANKE